MKTLITGSAGFLGAHLTVAAGLGQVTAVSRTSQPAPSANEVHYVSAELTDLRQVHALFAVEQPDVILHAAAKIPRAADENIFTFFDDNVRATANIYHAAAEAGVKRLIFSSTMSVYGPPQFLPVSEDHPTVPDFPYALSKIQAELIGQYFAGQGIKTTVLRYSGIFGAGQRSGAVPAFIGRCLQDAPMTLNACGRPSSDFVWVDDVVKANLLAVTSQQESNFEVINIGSGEELSVLQLAEMIQRLTSSKSEIRPVEGPSPRNFRFGYDISKARRQLGFEPTPVETAIKECIRQKREGSF